MESFSSVCSSEVYIIMFHLLNNLVEDIKRFRYVAVLDGSVYKQLNIHIKKTYRGSSSRRTGCVQKAERLLERQQKGERPMISTELGSSSQGVVRSRVSRCMKKGAGLL